MVPVRQEGARQSYRIPGVARRSKHFHPIPCAVSNLPVLSVFSNERLHHRLAFPDIHDRTQAMKNRNAIQPRRHIAHFGNQPKSVI